MRTIRTLTTGLATLTFLAGSALGAMAQAPSPTLDPLAPAEFSGRFLLGEQTVTGTEALVDGTAEQRGNVFAPTVAHMTDPRLDGTITLTINFDRHPMPDSDGVVVQTVTWRIENEAGAWQGSEQRLWLSDGSRSTTTAVLTGERAYAGLIAAWENDTLEDVGWDVRGFIVPGEAPPAP